LRTVTSRERFGLVTIQGVDYQIVDIGLRMLEPAELYRAQGFPADYVIKEIPDRNYRSRTATRPTVIRCCCRACR
jgi:DNA (cytosine-5)-methyltransferase 1